MITTESRVVDLYREPVQEVLIVKTLLPIFFCVILLSAGSLAIADTVADLTEVYTDAGAPGLEYPAPTGIHGIIGAGLFNGERIIGDTRRRTVLLPIVLMTYQDRAYWSIGGGGLWLFQSDDHALKLGIGVKVHPGYRPDDNSDLAGMEPRSTSLDGFVNSLWKAPVINVGLRFYHDIGQVSQGDSITLRLSHNFIINPEFRLTPSLGVDWLNAKYVDYYYGVRQAEALPGRPAYTGRATVNVGVGVAGAYRVSRSWSFLGGLYSTHLGGGIEDSPIVTNRSSTLVYFGAGWIF